MSAVRWAAGAALSVVMLATPASAQEERPNYKALLEQGFEIKATMFVPAEVSTRIAGSVQQDSVVITLQKGSQTAACWTTFVLWHGQNIGTVPCNVVK